MYSKVLIIGRVVNDPTLKYSQQGKAITSFSIAVDRSQDETDFFDIVAFDKQAEVASKYLAKGRLIMVEGRLQTRTFETQDGSKRKIYEIIVDTFRMLDKKQDLKTESERKIDYEKRSETKYETKYDTKKHVKPYKDFDDFEEDEIIEHRSSKTSYTKPKKNPQEDFDDFFFDEN